MLTALLVLACGPGLIFVIGSWAVFCPGGPGLDGPAAPEDDADYEAGDLGC